MDNYLLTQSEANALITAEKHRADQLSYNFPMQGQSTTIPLVSSDRREQFMLDLSRGRIDMHKVKIQNRARAVIPLVRLDLGGSLHRNPDGEEIPSPHLHIYREGYGDKWAIRVPINSFTEIENIRVTFDDFLRYCNVTVPPHIEWPLFL